MVLRSALAHRLQNHVWIRGSAGNHYLQIPARPRLQFSSVARSTSFRVLFAALSLTEVTDVTVLAAVNTGRRDGLCALEYLGTFRLLGLLCVFLLFFFTLLFLVNVRLVINLSNYVP